MSHVGPKLLPALLVLPAASCSSLRQSTEDVITAYVTVNMPTVIAFLPPSIQRSRDKDAAGARRVLRTWPPCTACWCDAP